MLGITVETGYVVGMPAHRRLQVFISSTFTDLKEERQAAVSAILAAGHFPAGMELFAAGSKSQMTTIERWIDESDVYMLILGHRYGSIEPKSRKSYTHIEYEYALSKDKPFFSVVATDEWRKAKQRVVDDPNSLVEIDNGPALKAFREIVQGRMCKMVDDAKDIKLAVHESLREVERGHQLVGWVRGDAIEREVDMGREIAILKREVAAAEKRAEKAEKLSKTPSEPNWQALSDTLWKKHIDATKAFSPERLRSLDPTVRAAFHTFPALSCLRFWRDSLLLGVTNAYGASAEEVFLWGRVVPTLLAHDLVEQGKAPLRVTWTRYLLSTKGKAFLNWLDSSPEQGVPAVPETASPGDSPPAHPPRTRRTRGVES